VRCRGDEFDDVSVTEASDRSREFFHASDLAEQVAKRDHSVRKVGEEFHGFIIAQTTDIRLLSLAQSERRRAATMNPMAEPAQTLAQAPATAPTQNAPLVGVIMGSDSDFNVMSDAVQVLRDFGIAHEVEVVSAHRTPEKMVTYANEAASRGLKVIIAGAGRAAHLPGMVASMTTLPVIGVPVPLAKLDGLDSLLSIVQMPGGIPVATVSIGGAKNAGLLAARILGATDPELAATLEAYQRGLAEMVEQKNEALKARIALAAGTAS